MVKRTSVDVAVMVIQCSISTTLLMRYIEAKHATNCIVRILLTKTSEEVTAAIAGFSSKYVDDWTLWLGIPFEERPAGLGKLLRKWQATRPHKMRRCRDEADHAEPFLDDLVNDAAPVICDLKELNLTTFGRIGKEQLAGLASLWTIFQQLPLRGKASCVGITKAVMLLTDGSIGPALDSHVRKNAVIKKPQTAEAWIKVRHDVAEDIAAFELSCGARLSSLAPEGFRHLEYGRLYDMALGPQ